MTGILNSEIYLPGYEIVRRNRNRNGGGVCFYIKTAISYSVRTDLNINNLENMSWNQKTEFKTVSYFHVVQAI